MHQQRVVENGAAASELIWLLGQPHLSDYVDFVRAKVIGGDAIPAAALVAEWRAANDLYYELSEREAGDCEAIGTAPLPDALAPLEAEVRAHPWFRRSFDDLPARFAMVELDRLIVSQTHVERGPHEAAAAALAPDDPAALFRFCIPLERDLPPVRIQRLGDRRWLFTSLSTDLRERDPMLIEGEALAALGADGPVRALLGLPLGFGSNFMSAVASGRRIALQNGYHRAVALRRAGFTHAPCILEEVTRKDELRLGGDEELNADPEFYFAAPRPPMLKDFFDPRIAKPLSVRPMETRIEVEIAVRTGTATDW
jgi:hypothetical protein